MVGQVYMQRCNDYKTLFGCMKVSAFALVLGWASAAYPVHGFAARAGLRDDALCRVAAAQACDLGGFELVIRQVGNIHIE